MEKIVDNELSKELKDPSIIEDTKDKNNTDHNNETNKSPDIEDKIDKKDNTLKYIFFSAKNDALKMRTIITFSLITVLSFVMRIVKISFNDNGTPVFDEKHYSVQGMQELLNGGIENNPGFGLIVHPPFGKFLISIGEAIFGYTPLGWRFSSIIAGTVIVLLICSMIHTITKSLVVTLAAGIIANTEGALLMMSRMGMLDIFQALFVTLIAFCLLKYMNTEYSNTSWTRRWWLLAVGISSGFAMSIKISGVYYPAVIGVLLVISTIFISKSLKETMASFFHGLFYLFVIPVSIFMLTWVPWFRDENSWSGRAVEQGIQYWRAPERLQKFIPDKLENWISYQLDVLHFHTGLTTSHGQLHPWESKPWQWLYGGRPMLFLDSVDGNKETKIWLLANMSVWWLIIPLSIFGLYRIFSSWDKGWVIATGGFLAGWVPWMIGYDRQMYFFYATVLAPFVVMMVVLFFNDTANFINNKSKLNINKSRIIVFTIYIILVLAVFLAYLPWYYGIPMDIEWHKKMTLFSSWEPLKEQIELKLF